MLARHAAGAPLVFEVDAVDPEYWSGFSVIARGVGELVEDPLQPGSGTPSARPWARWRPVLRGAAALDRADRPPGRPARRPRVAAAVRAGAVSEPAAADVLLADGTVAVVRPLRAEDAGAVHDLHDRVSDEAIRLRFFAPSRHAAHSYVDGVLARPETLAMVAEVRGEIVGLGTAEPMDETTCEVAFLVADETRGQGVGTLLLEHLAALARDRGFTHLEADVLLENRAMLGVFTESGLSVSRSSDGSTVIVGLTTEAGRRGHGQGGRARVPRRGGVAGAAAPPALGRGRRRPVGRHRHRRGRAPRDPRTAASRAPSPPCTRAPQEILDVPAYPTVSAVPGPVDLVVLCVPGARRGRRAPGRGRGRGPGRGRGVVGLRRARRGRSGAAARAGRHRPLPRHPDGRPQLPRPALQRPGRPAQRHLPGRRAPAGRARRSPASPAASAS